MRAGYGQAELTPELGTELVGYGYYLERRCTGIADPLYARAVCLEDAGKRYAIVSCDFLGLSQKVTEQVKEGLVALGIARDAMMLVSIHTHTGPGVISHEGCGEICEGYVQQVPRRILAAIQRATKDLAPVETLSGKRGEIPEGLIYNRSNPEGFLDRGVRSIRIRRCGKPEIRLVSLGCHAVCSGVSPLVSADYPGAVVRSLGEHTVFLNGLCGDVDPVRETGMDGEALRERLGAAISKAAGTWEELPVSLTFGSIPFTLRLTEVTREMIRESAARAVERAGGEAAGAARVARIWEKDMLSRFDALSFTKDVRIPWLRLGGRLILALPFEGFGKIGGIVRDMLNEPDTMVLGCGEELLGYLPTEDDMQRGAYAALESTYLYRRLPPVPGEAERLGSCLGEALIQLRIAEEERQ